MVISAAVGQGALALMYDFDIKTNVSGGRAIVDKLSKLPTKLQEKAGKVAARKAMGIVRRAAQSASKALDDPNSSERIWKNVYLQQSRRGSKAVGGVMMRVGILGGARQYGNTKANIRKGRAGQSYQTGGSKSNPGGDTWYWRLVELGTEKVPARPFLRPALENNAHAVTSTLITELSKNIDQLAAGR
jgi:HK97 gp10 family phage protein